jgi:hypothetical protein
MPRQIADNSAPLPHRSWETQAARSRQLLHAARIEPARELQFTLEVSALHLARAIPDYWYTVANLVAQESQLPGREAKDLADCLSQSLEEVFTQARHYKMLDALRRWDFHWEPLKDPTTFQQGDVVRRGAPMRLTTGPTPNSSAGMLGFELFFTGSGRRLGRANYYEIQNRGFVDEEAAQSLSLQQAISEFLDDLPQCHVAALAIPEIQAYLGHPMRLPFPDHSNFGPPAP